MADSIFLEKMGDSPQTKILDFLLTFREFDYSPTDIAKESEVSWITAKKVISHLRKQEILIETRKVGRAKMYKLNANNKFVKDLTALYDSLLNSVIDIAAKKEKIFA